MPSFLRDDDGPFLRDTRNTCATWHASCWHAVRDSSDAMRRILFLILLLVPPIAHAQERVTLRPAASFVPGTPLLLGDVAHITGENAEVLSAIELTPDAASITPPQVDVALVREALKKTKGINLGRLTIGGASCALHEQAHEAAPLDAALVDPQGSTPGGETVRSRALACLAQTFGVAIHDLRATFAPEDAPLLAFPVAGLTVAVQPLGTGEMTPLGVRLFRGNQLVRTGSLRATVLVRREVAITKAAISRGRTLDADSITLGEQWLTPVQSPATPTQTIGAEARTALRAGAVIMASDVEPPQVIARGDIASVDCIAGSVVVRAQARALENARTGQVIRFQSLTGKREFRARVSGPGHAVALAGGGASPHALDAGGLP